MSSFFRKPAALFLLALVFFALGNQALPLMDRDEPRFAEAAREMRQGGDWVVPYFNHHVRFDKPPWTYWCQIAAYKLMGETDFAARFPSVLAGALTVLGTYWFCRRLGGRRLTAPDGQSAWVAALVLMTCAQLFLHARAAVADAWLTLFFTLASWAAAELLGLAGGEREKPLGRWRLLFYGALALGFLAKGPVALLPLVVVGVYAGLRKPGEVLRRFQFGRGCLGMLAVVALWGVPALLRTEGAFFSVGIGKHVVSRSMIAMEGHGGKGWLWVPMLPFFFVTVFASFFPWSVQLPWLARKLRSGRMENGPLFLLCGVGVVFGVFTLVRTKLPHYTLPAFPLLAILLAREWEREPRFDPVKWGAWALGTGAALALVGFPLAARSLFPGAQLIANAEGALKPEMEFACAGYQEGSLIWYARRTVRGWGSPMPVTQLPAFMARPGARFCVALEGTLAPQPEWRRFTASGINLARGERVRLELFVKEK